MKANQERKHRELETLFGMDFLPLSRTSPSGTNRLDAIRKEVSSCQKCTDLCTRRTQTVFGVGDEKTPLMFVGEAPGADEDAQGEPFVGRAGQLLTKTLAKIGISRSQIYIANILKCRPPDNRNPNPEEMANCMPYLLKQIKNIRPKAICCMGNIATRSLLQTKLGITKIRGQYQTINEIRFFPIYHPAYVLRNMSQIKVFEGDLRKVCQDVGLLSE
ncbi:MAG: uracil-DNA glycosylase [Planctomycetota bacterium]|jgi:DNA polymerase|nr:uracil-DNA glycosylase [Planctomycetota bacterium]